MTDCTTEVVEGNRGVLHAKSEEEMAAIQKQAQKYMAADGVLRRICNVMISSRQLYALARLALTREIEREGHVWDDGVEEFLIEAMMQQALRPFSRAEVTVAVRDIVTEFLLDELNIEQETERSSALLRLQREESDRLSLAVPFGYADIAMFVERGRSYTFIGSDIDALQQRMLRRICNTLEAHKETEDKGEVILPEGKDPPSKKPLFPAAATVIHMLARTPENQGEVDPFIAHIKPDVWHGLLNQRNRAERILDEIVANLYRQRVDLVVVEGLDQLIREDAQDPTSRLRRAEAAHRYLIRWCKEKKAALVTTMERSADMPAEEYRTALEKYLGKFTEICYLEDWSEE